MTQTGLLALWIVYDYAAILRTFKAGRQHLSLFLFGTSNGQAMRTGLLYATVQNNGLGLDTSVGQADSVRKIEVSPLGLL